MKYMGWGYDELMSLPASYYPVLVELMKEEADRIKGARDGGQV